MSEFYFALTNPEAEALLKAEIHLRWPGLKLSYSRSGFLTFKGGPEEDFSPIFARLSGRSLGKFPLNELKFSKAWVWKRDKSLDLPTALEELSHRSLFKIGETVPLIMMIGPEEFWVGEYVLKITHFQTPGEESPVEEREVPSRAYYKMAEAYDAFDLPFGSQETVLELGSAPGGASLFLLEQELKVIGVDPADMEPTISKNANFKHLRRSFETLTAKDLPPTVDWVVSDVNLPPTVVVKEVMRMLEFLKPRGLILTLKINQEKHLQFLKDLRESFRKKGFKQVEFKYLPSHRQEVALIALRS